MVTDSLCFYNCFFGWNRLILSAYIIVSRPFVEMMGTKQREGHDLAIHHLLKQCWCIRWQLGFDRRDRMEGVAFFWLAFQYSCNKGDLHKVNVECSEQSLYLHVGLRCNKLCGPPNFNDANQLNAKPFASMRPSDSVGVIPMSWRLCLVATLS